MGLFDFFKTGSETAKIDLSDFKFISNDHIRYQNGTDISGHNYDCWRGIRVQDNISGKSGYTVTIYNLDGNHPVWGNNIQMAPKQMKIVKQDSSLIKLVGFGADSLGNSFADYGLTLHISSDKVERVSLQLLDRNIEIVYFKEVEVKRSTSGLATLFSLSKTISESNDKNVILKSAIELRSLILNNKDLFDSAGAKELYDSMEQSYKALLKSIPFSTSANERFELVEATFFVLSSYRVISPGNGNVCEDKIRLLIKYKSDILRLFQSIDKKTGKPNDENLAYDVMLFYLLDDNSFMLQHNADLKQMHSDLTNKFSSKSSNAHNLGKMSEKRYFALMNE